MAFFLPALIGSKILTMAHHLGMFCLFLYETAKTAVTSALKALHTKRTLAKEIYHTLGPNSKTDLQKRFGTTATFSLFLRACTYPDHSPMTKELPGPDPKDPEIVLLPPPNPTG